MLFLTAEQEATADRLHQQYGIPLFIADVLAALPEPPAEQEPERRPEGLAGRRFLFRRGRSWVRCGGTATDRGGGRQCALCWAHRSCRW